MGGMLEPGVGVFMVVLKNTCGGYYCSVTRYYCKLEAGKIGANFRGLESPVMAHLLFNRCFTPIRHWLHSCHDGRLFPLRNP